MKYVHAAVLVGFLSATVSADDDYWYLCCLTFQQAKPPPLDPAGTWVETPWGKPVIDRGAAGTWNHYAVDNPYVHVDDGKFYCFFEAQDKPFDQGGHEAFGLAVSGDVPAGDAYGVWIRAVIVLNSVSLVIDAVDVVRYLAGDRAETVAGL